MSLDKQNQADKKADQILSKTEKSLIQEYSQALKKIRQELAQLYATFPLNREKRMDRRRLENLQLFIEQEINRIYKNNSITITERLSEIYKEMYYMTGWAIESSLPQGTQLAWGLLNHNVIRQAMMVPIAHLTLNDRLERNRKLIIREIGHQLTQGLILGHSYEQMAQNMKKVLEQDAIKARTIARTEGHRIRNAGKLESMKRAKELGIQMKKVWDATLDKRTRQAHRKLDGKKVGVDEDFISPNGGRGPAPGLMKNAQDDISCRCIFRLELVGYEPSVRWARNEGIVDYQTYEEWAKRGGYV